MVIPVFSGPETVDNLQRFRAILESKLKIVLFNYNREVKHRKEIQEHLVRKTSFIFTFNFFFFLKDPILIFFKKKHEIQSTQAGRTPYLEKAHRLLQEERDKLQVKVF